MGIFHGFHGIWYRYWQIYSPNPRRPPGDLKNSFFWTSFMSKPLPNIGFRVLFFRDVFWFWRFWSLLPIWHDYHNWRAPLFALFCLAAWNLCFHAGTIVTRAGRKSRELGKSILSGFFLPNGVFQRCFKLRKCILVFFTSWICPNVQVNIDLVRSLDEMPDTAHPQLDGRGQVFCFLELGNFKSLGNTGDLTIIGKSRMIRFSLISSMVSKNVHRM